MASPGRPGVASLRWAGWMALALAFGAGRGAAQEEMSLSRVGTEAGLSHNSVYSLLQDRQGFLWVGTVDGLNRYDGYTFLTYRHDPSDSRSLSNPVVRCLLEDSRGELWVGTDNGLDRLDRRQGRFTRYTLRDGAGETVRIVW